MVVHQKSAQVVPRILVFFFSSRRRHTRLQGDWSSDVCSSDLDEVPGGHAVSFEREVFPKLVGGDLYGRLVDGYWIDIGTPERYLEATYDLLAGVVESDLPPRDESGSLVAAGCITSGARIGPQSVLGPHCSVGAGATVERSVLHAR